MPTIDSPTITATLTKCLKHLQMIEDCYMVLEKFNSEFKGFLQTLNVCFNELITNSNLVLSTPCKSKILLCLSQTSKSLKLFIELLRKPLYRQGVWYVCERLRCCLSELRCLCCSSEVADCDDGETGCFVRQVDAALQLLESKGAAVVRHNSWTLLVNDVVCQAVTIAKIAAELDYKEITSACQVILEIKSQLMKENEVNSNQLSLMVDSMFNNIVSLEERVNVAILRLVLQVFSEPCGPVKQLVKHCGQAPHSRSLTDLDSLVADLDAHIERIMLIGQFAVSCCDDASRVSGMKCCLASIESIDNYLVPALKSLYLTPQCDDKRLFAQLMCHHWQDEVNTLHSHLDNIIDNTAFIRVVQESVSDLSNQVCREEAKEEVCNVIIKQSWLLYKHLTPSGADLTLLKQSLCECEAAIDQNALRPAIAKRVRLVVAAVDKLAESLVTSKLSQQTSDEKYFSDTSSVPKSIRDLPLDISLASTKSQYASYRPQWLQKKLCEAKKKISKEESKIAAKDESVLSTDSPKTPKHRPTRSDYETPKNTVKSEGDLLTPFLAKTTERNTTLYVRTPRRVIQKQMTDESVASGCSWSTVSHAGSLALDISDILENLSVLADTLSSSKETETSKWEQPQPTPTADIMKQYFSGSSFDSQWFSQTSVRTDEVSADVDTLDRINDLKLVDEKIHRLKTS